MGDDSCSKGCGFESQRHILDGHFFTFICCKNCIVFLKRPIINEKELAHFFKKITLLATLHCTRILHKLKQTCQMFCFMDWWSKLKKEDLTRQIPKDRITLGRKHSPWERITVRLVSSIRRLDLTKKEKKMLFGCKAAVESRHGKLETRCAMILPPNGKCYLTKGLNS